MRKVYLSGKVSGTDDFVERFDKAAKLVATLFDNALIVNMVQVGKALPKEISYECLMDVSCTLLRHCDVIFMLRGWEDSAGAKVEKSLAEQLGIPVRYEDELENLVRRGSVHKTYSKALLKLRKYQFGKWGNEK